MIRHLLFKIPETLCTLRPGDWISTFAVYPGSLLADPLETCPYVGNVSLWQATPDNAAKVLSILADRLRFRCPDLVLVLKKEFFQGGLYFHEDGKGYILVFRSAEVSAETCRGFQKVAAQVRISEEENASQGVPPFDALEGLEAAEVWTLGGI